MGRSTIEYRHFLTHNSAKQSVVEPEDFANFESGIKRDFDAHGLFYRFTPDDIKLGFVGLGRTILETAFQEDGLDASVTYTVDSRPDEFASWANVFAGTAVMSNREVDKDYFRIDFENAEFIEKINNRFKIKLDLAATTTLDGGTIASTITQQQDLWPTVQENSEFAVDYRVGSDSTLKVDVNTTGQDDSSPTLTRYWKPFFNAPQTSQLGERLTITEDTAFQSTKPTNSNAFFRIEKGGTLTISLETFKAAIELKGCSDAANSLIQGTYTWVIEHWQNAALLTTYDRTDNSNWGETEAMGEALCAAQVTSGFTTNTGDLTDISFAVNTSDQLVLYLKCEMQDIQGVPGDVTGDFDLDMYHNARIHLTLLDTSVSHQTKHYLIFDVLTRLVFILTGRDNAVQSDFYKLTDHGAASDGCGALQTITNGYQLRFEDIKPEMSLFDCLMSLKARDAIGWGIEDHYADEDWVLRIEAFEFFYSDNQIMNLGKVDDFKAEIFEPLVFNQFTIGYDKFSKAEDDAAGDGDDYLTQIEYLLPFSKVKGSKKITSSFIASGHLITVGLKQRASTESTWRHTEDIFIVDIVRSGSDFIPEHNENFDSVSGVDAAASSYNLRSSPMFMFLNHALFLNSAVHGKNIDDISFLNQGAIINKSFTAQIKTSFTCQDPEGYVRSSTADVPIFKNFYGFRLFEPTKHSFQIGITNAQVNTLIEACTGSAISANYGYLTYTDENGNIETGFILSIKWNPSTEEAKIECVERTDNYLV